MAIEVKLRLLGKTNIIDLDGRLAENEDFLNDREIAQEERFACAAFAMSIAAQTLAMAGVDGDVWRQDGAGFVEGLLVRGGNVIVHDVEAAEHLATYYRGLIAREVDVLDTNHSSEIIDWLTPG